MEAKNPKSITTNPGGLPPPLKNCQNPKIRIFTNKPTVFFCAMDWHQYSGYLIEISKKFNSSKKNYP